MYILRCSNGKFYVGSTKFLQERLKQHQEGEGANYTKKHLPVELVYCEKFEFVADAFKREKQIKNWSHAKKKALIEGKYEEVNALAKKKFK